MRAKLQLKYPMNSHHLLNELETEAPLSIISQKTNNTHLRTNLNI